MYDSRLCQHFEACIKASNGSLRFENDRLIVNNKNSIDYQKMRSACPARALSVAGELKTVDEIIFEIEKDLPFYNSSNGGITLTGGEPLAQGDYLLKLVKSLKEKNIDVAIETSLHIPWKRISPYIDFVDCWLVDLKHVDENKFKSVVGGNAKLVMQNFKKLDSTNAKLIVRVPVIPDFNHTNDEMKNIIDFAASLHTVKEIHFIPYHMLGKGKYELLGIDYKYKNISPLPDNALDFAINYAKEQKLKYKIGG
jgi:pyruvate formate lyase activating enzyme